MYRARGSFGVSLLASSLLVGLAALVGFVGCASFRVTTDYDPQANFQRLQSYAWLATVRQPSDDPRLHNSLVDARVRAAVDCELAARGYSKTSGSSATFLVTYYVALETKIDVQTIYSSYGYGHRGWHRGVATDTMVSQYEEGTLLVDILDSKGGDLLWRGSASARVRESSSPEERETRINEAVAAILAEFPPH